MDDGLRDNEFAAVLSTSNIYIDIPDEHVEHYKTWGDPDAPRATDENLIKAADTIKSLIKKDVNVVLMHNGIGFLELIWREPVGRSKYSYKLNFDVGESNPTSKKS